MQWLKTDNSSASVRIGDIPVLDYPEFFRAVTGMLGSPSCHVGHYFAHPLGNELVFFMLLLDDSDGSVNICAHRYGYYAEDGLQSIAASFPAVHPFEREISELYGIQFNGSTWNKPLRLPHNRANRGLCMDNYPFYSMEGPALHEVNVGPIHAGIIEPGAFRFICNGERVLHLEIALGYQHRGVETLMTETDNILRRCVLAEAVAGDTAIGHTSAFAAVMEKLVPGYSPEGRLDAERAIALELERIAMHIADTGALCMDIGYQLGQVACEALRTIVINTTQLWCGNRFGKGLIRPFGTNYPITSQIAESVLANLAQVKERYHNVREDLKATASLLSRFEDCGTVPESVLVKIGAVGLAARAAGLKRDVRASHPYTVWNGLKHVPEFKTQGDIMARLLLRGKEVFQSIDYVSNLIEAIGVLGLGDLANNPQKTHITASGIYMNRMAGSVESEALSFALVEGWRGEIMHCALTDEAGRLSAYKIKDPSLHNWLALAIAVRGEGISDFPLCNKSFNLSYCGHDL